MSNLPTRPNRPSAPRPTRSTVVESVDIHFAQAKAAATWPMIADKVWRPPTVEQPGLGTMAVDEQGRLYWDQADLDRWGLEKSGGSILHEILHLVMRHAQRRRLAGIPDGDGDMWNVAADLEINSILAVGLPGPGGQPVPVPIADDVVMPEHHGLPRGRTAEWYYSMLCAQRAQQQGQGQGQGQPNSSPAPPSPAPGNAQKTGSSLGNTPPSGSSTPTRPGTGKCGSCATGIRGAHELPSDDKSHGEPIGDFEGDAMASSFAKSLIQNASKLAGYSALGVLLDWAKERLKPPPIPWDRVVKSHLKQIGDRIAGYSHDTYAIPSRRTIALWNTGAKMIMPSTESYPPNGAVVLDTSGSMQGVGQQALGVVESLCKAMAVPITVLSTDAKVRGQQKVMAAAKLKVRGGGGTDMRVGIDEAMRLRPRPSFVVVVTDGETPWPESKPERAEVVVVVVHGGRKAGVPAWAKLVAIDKDGNVER